MRLANFREQDKVLLLGEGNFSFAVSLVKHNLPMTITASCYESSIVHEITRNNVDFLHDHGIRVIFGVDATKIEDNPILRSERFDKIIFNFPHVGGKMRLDKNRELLRKFFISIEKFLEDDGLILMTLCNGQGGTLTDEPKRRWDDSWKVKEMSAYGNFILTNVEPFQVKNFSDYCPTGYRGLHKEFNIHDSLTHIFKKSKLPSLKDFAPKISFDLSTSKDLTNLNPPIYKFDITFSISEDFQESNFYNVLHNFFGNIVQNVDLVRNYTFPDGKVTRTYKISYQSDLVPLYRSRIVEIHQELLTEVLEKNLSVTVTR